MSIRNDTNILADNPFVNIDGLKNANSAASDTPHTKLGTMVKSGTDSVGTLLSDATAGVKNRSVESRLDRFLDKCAKFFQRIGSLLNLCDSPEIQAARKNAKAIKLETEGLLRCFKVEHAETETQLQVLQSHLKENGSRLNATEIFTLKNKIVENGEVIDMCETHINELKAKLKGTTDIGCQLHLMQAAKDLAKLATETHRLSLEIMELLSRAGATDIPNIRNVPDPDASAPTIAEKRVLFNTNEVLPEKPSVGMQPKGATNIPQPPTHGERQAAFETIRSAFKSTSETVANEPDIKRNPKTAEDASPSRPNLEPSWHEKAKKVLEQPKLQGNTAPFGTFQFRQKRNVAAHKTSLLEPIPEEEKEIRKPNSFSSEPGKPSDRKIGKGNRIAFKGTEKPKKEPKPSALEKRKAYSENVVASKLKNMNTGNTFNASENNWNTTNKFQTDASGNKGITHNSKIQEQLDQRNETLNKF
jgi:hypothetical protein